MFRPDAKALIDIARQTLIAHVLPARAGEAHYEGLMIANALGIALRELQAVEEMRQRQESMLGVAANMLGNSTVPEQTPLACGRNLALAIREGAFDAACPQRSIVRNLLIEDVRARLAIDNPKALNRQE